jgi:hypothetical protein
MRSADKNILAQEGALITDESSNTYMTGLNDGLWLPSTQVNNKKIK